MADEQAPGWYTNDQGRWGYFDGTSFEMREPPAHIRVSAATSRPEPSPLEQYGPLGLAQRATKGFLPAGVPDVGEALEGAARQTVHGLLGLPRAALGAVTSPIETAKALGRGVVAEAPTIAGGLLGAILGGGVASLPLAALGAAGGKAWQKTFRGLTQGQASPEAQQTSTEALTDIIAPAMETVALPVAGKLLKGGAVKVGRILPGSSLERGTMAVENVRRGAREILPKTTPEEAAALYRSSEAIGEQVPVAGTPLEPVLKQALEALDIRGAKLRATPMNLATASRAYQDLRAKLGAGDLTQLQRPSVERAMRGLEAELEALAGQGPITTLQKLAGQPVSSPGATATAEFFEAGKRYKEATTAQEVLDFLERRGAQFVEGGRGERLTGDRLLTALKNPTAGERFTWRMLDDLDPQALARIEDVIREQSRTGLLPSTGGGNPITRAAMRYGIPVGVGGSAFGGRGALAGYMGAEALRKAVETPIGRAIVRAAWTRPAPLDVPFGPGAARTGLATIALGGNDSLEARARRLRGEE